MEFKKVFVSEIKPAQYNPRKDLQPTDPEYQRIKKSIEEFGYVDPIILNSDYTIIGGHQRLKVLKELGQAQIDVVVVDLPKTKEKALNVALNKISGEWDMEQLSIILSELKEEDFDISITGFSDKELKEIDEELFGKQAQEDDYEPPAEIKTDIKRGDIILLGRHRLMCGDSTSKEDVGRLMDGKKADLAASDPPYNVNEDYVEYSDTLNEDEYEKNTRGWFNLLQSNSKVQIVTPGCNNLARWCRYFDPYHVAPWTKANSMTNGKIARFWCWEPVLFFGEKIKRTRPNDIFEYPIGSQKEVGGHPCPKPLKFWGDLVQNYSNDNDLVLDLFLGSGTTLIACEQLNRICYGMEISPQYCEVICQRWEKLTGKKREYLKE